MTVAARTDAPPLTRFATSPGAKTWNEKARTFRAVIAAGAGVSRMDWDGPYTEFLDPTGVELPAQVPVLNTHRRGNLSDVIGAVEKVERVGDKLEAVIRLSARPEVDAIVADVRDGIVTGVSVGYMGLEWVETEDKRNGVVVRTKTAKKWRLLEVSIVPIPADDAARIRSKPMSLPAASGPEDEPAAPKRRVRKEDRVADAMQLRGLASVANLDNEWIDQQIEEGVTLGEARARAIDAMAERSASLPNCISMVGLDPVTGLTLGESRSLGRRTLTGYTTDFATAMGEAIAARAMPDIEPSPDARQFVGLSLPEMARECLAFSGADVRGISRGQIVTRAFEQRSMGGLHSTSDFVHALTSAAHAVMRRSYEQAPSALKPLARRITLADFRARKVVGVSGFSMLEKVNEAGEFKRGTFADSGEAIQLETFGKIFGVTRQVIVNDDLGFIADVPRRLGLSAASFEAERLASVFTGNPVMGDGKAVFHADHGNLAASGAALSETSLSAARLAMRRQKDEAGHLIGIAPKFLVVGPELETAAEKLMAAITPSDTDEVQPIKLTVAVEPRITGKGWYLAADPAMGDGLAYAYLDAEPGPQLDNRVGFDIDGVEFRVRLDFGASFLDWRPFYRNPGA